MEPISLKLHVYIWPRSLMPQSHYCRTAVGWPLWNDLGVWAQFLVAGVHITRNPSVLVGPLYLAISAERPSTNGSPQRLSLFYLGWPFKEGAEELWQKYHRRRQRSPWPACSVVKLRPPVFRSLGPADFTNTAFTLEVSRKKVFRNWLLAQCWIYIHLVSTFGS